MMDFTEGSKDDGLQLSAEVFCFTPPALKKLQEKQAKAAKAGKPVPPVDTLPEMPVGKAIPADDLLVLTNTTDKALKFRFDPCQLREFTISFKPVSGTLKPHKTVRITAKLTVHVRVNTNYRVTLKVNDGSSSHFITAKIRCETGVFGVDPATLEMCEDSFDKNSRTWRVPVILKNLKDCLVAAGGLRSEGVFRLAGELTVLKSAKEQINRSSASNSGPGCIDGEHSCLPDDVNDLATLIKIWYRELPQPILNGLPSKVVMDSDDVDDCVAAAAKLPELQRDLLDWILELLLRVAANRATTKMTAQNLAIVVAPNLYEATTPDPMQGLVMSQKAVQFVHNILVHMVHEREKATGTKLDTELHKKDLKHTPCSQFCAKGPVAQPLSTPDSSAADLPPGDDGNEEDEAEEKEVKTEEKKKKKKSKKSKKAEEEGNGKEEGEKKAHHHHHHRERGNTTTSKNGDDDGTAKKKDSKKVEGEKGAVVATESVPVIADDKDSSETPRTRKESHADRKRKESHADKPRKESHADKPRKESHADKPRKESHADKPRKESHADKPRKESHADKPRKESHADRSHKDRKAHKE